MAPKKLTDCPENLRESIDWLIQIRNGGDKTGLQNLAKALGTLINQAIDDAKTSLESEVERLTCPIIYEGNLTYCQFNDRSVKQAEKELDDLQNKKNPESESQKKRLGEEIEQFKRSKNECIEYTHPRYPESQTLKDVKAQLKAFQEFHNKLKLFLSDLQKTVKNQSEGILGGLCSGFEKFLSFDAATKGYDGRALVYSDVDRLFDAVMAFLHESLKRNESLLKHYYPGITENIEALKGAIGKGCGVDGFAKVIKNVSNGLHGYERELGVRTKKFVDHVESLYNALDHKLKEIADSASEKNLCRIQSVFNAYVDYADSILKKLQNNGEVIRELDDNLKAKLSHTVELIYRSLINVGSVSQSSGVLQAVNAVQAAFDTLPVQLENYIITNVATKISGHDSVIKQLKTGVEQAINGTRDAFLIERLKVAKEDLANALQCAQDNALNMGGLRNETIVKTLRIIEAKLNTVDDNVSDKDTLGKQNVNEQIGNIIEELNSEPMALQVTSTIRGVIQKIKEPTDFFQVHKKILTPLLKGSKDDLEEAIASAGNNVKSEIGLKNREFMEAMSVIQGQLNGVDTSINSMKKLRDLQADPVEAQIQTITRSLNKTAIKVISSVQRLSNVIGQPEQIFISKHSVELQLLATNAQKEMISVIELAEDYVRCTDFGLNRKIINAFKPVLDSNKRTAEAPALAAKVVEELQKIGKLASEFNDTDGIASKFGNITTKLSGYTEAIKSEILSKGNNDDEITRWTRSMISVVVSSSFSEANEAIVKAERQYQGTVGRDLQSLKKEIKDFAQKAESGELEQFVHNLQQLRSIKSAVIAHSVYQEDQDARRDYFDKLQSQFDHIIKSLSVAYRQAYQSTAKTYLSGAIKAIKEQVEMANDAYGMAVSIEIEKVRSKINALKDTDFETSAGRDGLSANVISDFTQLLAKVKEYSVFQNDVLTREKYFENLRKVIKGTLDIISAAYKEAYRSAAKAYLSNSIKVIREDVENAERSYKAAVEEHLSEITSKFRELKKDQFKMIAVSSKPSDVLDYHSSEGVSDRQNQIETVEDVFTDSFMKLQQAVKKNSAFRADFSSRQACFSNLEELFDNIIDTLVKSVKTFDACAGAAKNCLDQSFTDAKTKMNTIGFDIRKQMNEVFEQVISAIYAMYSEEKKAELETLRKCFTEGCEKVKDIIYNDKVTGIKGFMQTIAGVRPNADTSHATSNTFLAVQIAMEKKTIKFSESCSLVKSYFDSVLIYIWNDIEPVIEPQFPTGRLYKRKVTDIRTALDVLFNHLIDTKDKIYNYDHTFVNLLEKLKNALDDLSPQEFGATAYPVLDALRKGLNGFTEQLGYAYINKYVGCKPIEWHGDKGGKQVSQDALRCARIFLTLIPEWDKHLPYLRRECIGGCSTKRISLIQTDNSKTPSYNALGDWFRHRGYVVSNFDKQEGELINNDKFKGTNIRQSLSKLFSKATIFNTLLYYMYEYYKLCHVKHIPSPNPPTTISQMLHWLCGLEYTLMYEHMKTYLQEWFNDFKKEHEIEKALPATVPRRSGHEVVTDFNLGNCVGSFENVTLCAYDVLLTILGYGDADGRYACEFYTNPYNLHYPTDKSKCFDMLVDICLRLNHQLRFLYMQCHNGTRSSGWADCRYGKNIAGSAWNCNRLQCVVQGCDQNCKWHNDCGVKSPLQSFLEDGLKGFLPHQFSSPSCKLECSVKNHNGIPCKTPMGFADISITASWTRTGRDIKKALDPFCGTLPDSLSMLCAYFLCLLRRPPQTLCDMFAFYENFFEHWSGYYDGMRKAEVKKHKQDAFYDAVAKANFGVEYDGMDPTTIFGSSSHSGDDATHLKGDMFAVVNCKTNEDPVHPCGSYLQPLSYEVRCVFTEKLAADYLSWIVYITETFYALLNDLYNKCTKCCVSQQADCYGRICAKGCTVNFTPEPAESKKLPGKTHGELCNSIVQCPGMHPTIFAAGFTFGSPWSLSGDKGVGKKRSCKDFCTALGMVVKENNVLYMLVHEKIPAFLWEIRYKFFYTLVALWAYSLLYLLYVIIGRLDTFHIRSHLRLPSSHKIAAQSLLATARLNNLAKLAYLRT